MLGDLALVHHAGRVAALQASAALAVVLLIVGGVIFWVDVQVQNGQIRSALTSATASADDVTDPPPGMILALRDPHGTVALGGSPEVRTALLNGRSGSSDVTVEGRPHRAYVADGAHGRVVALLDLQPYQASRNRLLLALAVAELAGILASIAVVVLLTRRSIRPLVQAIALQRRFVADASHELRAPLTVLATRAQVLARDPRFANVEQLDALVADTRALADVIDDLLASAALTQQGHREPVDLAALAAEVCSSFSEFAAAGGVRLEVGEPTGDVEATVLGSASALRRAVAALVDNALAHEHPGGTVTVSTTRRGADVVVQVRDDGVGVDPKTVNRLFERFAHGDNQIGGARRYGIGLALVREIAEAHDGEIGYCETPGGGATFTLAIPSVRRAAD